MELSKAWILWGVRPGRMFHRIQALLGMGAAKPLPKPYSCPSQPKSGIASPRNVKLATGSLCLSPFSKLGRWVARWSKQRSMAGQWEPGQRGGSRGQDVVPIDTSPYPGPSHIPPLCFPRREEEPMGKWQQAPRCGCC